MNHPTNLTEVGIFGARINQTFLYYCTTKTKQKKRQLHEVLFAKKNLPISLYIAAISTLVIH